MKILCAISGIEFEVEHFPASFTSRESVHPIFQLKQKKLVSFIGKWSAGELTPTDSLLLFLALLNSTELIEWRTSFFKTPITDSLVANNMEELVKTVSAINLVKNPALAIPSFVCSKETSTLDNIQYWIESWNDALDSFRAGYKSSGDWERIRNREAALERLIKTSSRDVSTYAGILADWAELAGNFPRYEIIDLAGVKVSMADYWKSIIKKCCKSESIFNIPKIDLEDLIEHCEDNIAVGTIFSHQLMKLLRDGLLKQKGFLGVDFSAAEFVILDADTSVEDANKLAMIKSAPSERPVERDFPTKFLYLKAKLKFDMASQYNKKLLEKVSEFPTLQTPEGEI